MGVSATDLPDEVVDWLAARRDRPWAGLVAPAIAALDAVVADSELAELWAEADDDSWAEGIAVLRQQLVTATT